MSTFPSYAGLGSIRCPFEVQGLMRQIGRIFGPSKILRTTNNLGAEGSFEDGARLAGAISRVELYKPDLVQEWALNRISHQDPTILEQPRSFQLRAAACASAVLGIDGQRPASELIIWLEPDRKLAQYYSIHVATEADVPIHNLADPGTFATWTDWAKEHATVPQ